MSHLQYSNVIPSNTKSFFNSSGVVYLIVKSFLISNYSESIPKGGILISTPTFKTTSQGTMIQIFYYVNPLMKIPVLNEKNLKLISTAISRIYPNLVEFQLVQQHAPYLNASILAQYLVINASKYGFHRIMTLLLNAVPYFNGRKNPLSTIDSILPGCTTGVKVQLSGLLTTQRNRARKTVYTASAGTFHSKVKTAETHVMTRTDYAESTSKSISGAFHIKV